MLVSLRVVWLECHTAFSCRVLGARTKKQGVSGGVLSISRQLNLQPLSPLSVQQCQNGLNLAIMHLFEGEAPLVEPYVILIGGTEYII